MSANHQESQKEHPEPSNRTSFSSESHPSKQDNEDLSSSHDVQNSPLAPIPTTIKNTNERDLEKAEEGIGSPNDSDHEDEKSPSSGWDSPEDPGNPKNWSFGNKVFHTAIPALYGFVITVGTSVYVPAIPYIMLEFNVSREVALLPLSLYTLGFVAGPIITAPISELYGRRCIYWTTMALLLIFIGISGAAQNITMLTIFRFLAGIGGSGALAVGAGTIADLWDMQTEGGRAALFYIMAPFLGPALGPLTGAYVIDQYHNNWRYSMWVIMMIAAPIAIMALFMKETSASRILYLRAKKAGLTQAHAKGDTHLLLSKLRTALLRPFHMMFVEPLVALLSIYTGFAFAMMFSFFGSYNYVFLLVYHFNQKEVGLTFLGILVGFFIAILSFGLFDATLYRKAAAKVKGRPAPEHRLYAAMMGSIALPIGLFWFAWAPHKDVHWIVPVLGGIPFGMGSLGVFISATTYLVEVYPAEISASAIAANGLLRYALGAAFPLFTLQMYQALGIHWAGSVFAFIALAMMPVPWAFFKHGEKLRKRSKYETSRN
ncbi:putative polyamine transporter 4 [Bisporella sp. PMI_857]|nr:putative polyamine transporter 4 [Bisporella sp. PMI_857]